MLDLQSHHNPPTQKVFFQWHTQYNPHAHPFRSTLERNGCSHEPPVYRRNCRKNLKDTSKDMDDNDIKSGRYSYVVIKTKLHCHCMCLFVLKVRQFTLFQQHILNRLCRAYQHPHRYESISNCACRNIGMNTVHRNPHNSMLCSEIFPCMHPTSCSNSSAIAIGHNHVSVVVAGGLVLFCTMSSADTMFDGCRCCFRPKLMLSHTTKCNRFECS